MKKKNERKIEELHMPKETYVPNPDIFLSPKISHPPPGEPCLVFNEHQKGHVHYQRNASDGTFSSYLTCCW